jgi:hypothetical protein
MTPATRNATCLSGEGGIRTHGTLLAPTRSPGAPIQPLSHLSSVNLCPLSEGNIDYRERRGRDANSRYHKGTVDCASTAFNHSPWIFLAFPLTPLRPVGLPVVIEWSSPWNAFYSTRCHRKRRDTYALVSRIYTRQLSVG